MNTYIRSFQGKCNFKLQDEINQYAENERHSIVSISLCKESGYYTCFVVFDKGLSFNL